MLCFFFLDLILGSIHIPFTEVLSSIFNGETQKKSWNFIIREFRLPKALTAILTGAGLAVSGLVMQTFFRNPLAGPYVLGISSGAGLGVAFFIMAGGILGVSATKLGTYGLIFSAIIGAMLVLILTISVSYKIADGLSLLIVGVMFGSLAGAVISVLQYFTSAEKLQAYVFWTYGSLSGVTFNQLGFFSGIVLLGLLFSFMMHKPLNALLLGENYAKTMGFSVKQIRLLLIISTGMLAGVITSFCGPIAFIGLAAPHLVRFLSNEHDHKKLIPLVALTGAIFMLICDIISQLPGQDTTLPINAVTAIFGAPIVIWVIVKNQKKRIY